MTANELRDKFLSFFEQKEHRIMPSAPMVVKDDPTLMFTNAGMNQFKDIFLGNSPVQYARIADSQKCLRVSGKHNDLEEVGHDTYHHTMFEMLGNWSFGNYFKPEAIAWAWEFLTSELAIDADRLYVTVFEGDPAENLSPDEEARELWKQHTNPDKIINGSKKDNFWEMGEQGPCGPCSEIHIDIRNDQERKAIDGKTLVNQDHPLVIEIWNLVFIQYNRKANGSLEKLNKQHVDTGMGFERLCMVVQEKQSNYDTDVFQPIIQRIATLSGKSYGSHEETNIAMRVIADHLRAVSFAIADGQIPSNNKGGYVIRRILRRAIRYAFTYLEQKEPFIYRLVNTLVNEMGKAYPELASQEEMITRVIQEEENTFLRTLAQGIKLLNQQIQSLSTNKENTLAGHIAFELYDTYGFPLDLTQLILKEQGCKLDTVGFEQEMQAQKTRSRSASTTESEDWVTVHPGQETAFVGYDKTEVQVKILRYRKVKQKEQTWYQLMLDQSPFYPEGGGQAGDSGSLSNQAQHLPIINTIKENQAILHITPTCPEQPDARWTAQVNLEKRTLTQRNHSATHLLHYTLREVLGTHVEQRGSLVSHERLRFDFSHFQKLTEEEIQGINLRVNTLIRENNPVTDKRDIPASQAKEMGAMALFGEKYGDTVRVIQLGNSIELCGGTHVRASGEIGTFILINETAIAAGIRRIEALTGDAALQHLLKQENMLKKIGQTLKSSKAPDEAVLELLQENQQLKKDKENTQKARAGQQKETIRQALQEVNDMHLGAMVLEGMENSNQLKEISAQLRGEIDNLVLILGAEISGKAHLSVAISEKLAEEKELHAGKIIKDIARHIQGGGGGQAFFATAGGKDPNGLPQAIEEAKKRLLHP